MFSKTPSTLNSPSINPKNHKLHSEEKEAHYHGKTNTAQGSINDSSVKLTLNTLITFSKNECQMKKIENDN